MSDLPGYTLERFVAWNYNLTVEGDGAANSSLFIAEAMGTIPRRKNLSQSQFARVVSCFEPYREAVENALMNFDEDNSWRDYAGCAFDFIPDEVFTRGAAAIVTEGETSHGE